MRVAIVHDYLREFGGAERVVEAMHEMWPEAPLYTSFVDKNALGQHWERFKNWDIRTSWVQNNWLVKTFHSPLRFLAPKIWESFNLSEYDVVISSSGWFMCRGVALRGAVVGMPLSRAAKVQTAFSSSSLRSQGRDDTSKGHASPRLSRPLHICYIHHPPRNLYGYATGSNLQKYWPVRVYATIVNFYLRHYDWETAQRVDYFIANSQETARRVEKFYRRDSIIIYPPVEISQGVALRKAVQGHPLRKQEYYLSVGRLTYSKRVDLAIEACKKLKLPLKIVGTGKEEGYLQKLASQGDALRSKNVEFLGSVSDEELTELYTGAKALVFCMLDEDFGMVPVEAMAHGVPVIALGQGGVLETVLDGQTGIVFKDPTVDSLVAALKKFLRIKKDWSNDCIQQSKKFSKALFQKELKAFVEKAIKGKSNVSKTMSIYSRPGES